MSTDGQTDGQTHYYSPISTNVGGQLKKKIECRLPQILLGALRVIKMADM